jgi:hypothetical protein
MSGAVEAPSMKETRKASDVGIDADDRDDWSQTGLGSHIDFGDEEPVPLEYGRFSAPV